MGVNIMLDIDYLNDEDSLTLLAEGGWESYALMPLIWLALKRNKGRWMFQNLPSLVLAIHAPEDVVFRAVSAAIKTGLLRREGDEVVCDRLVEEYNSYKDLINKRKEAGAKGGKARPKNPTKQMLEHLLTKTIANSQAKPKHPKDQDKDQDKDLCISIPIWAFEGVWREALIEWLEYKIKIKKPYTAAKSIERLLTDWGPKGAKAFSDAVNHSIAQGYQGLFPPRNGYHKPSTEELNPDIFGDN